jgi:lipopolysaccharide transport system ATP-binding protein
MNKGLAVSLQNVSFEYKTRGFLSKDTKKVLNNVTCDITKGQTLGILGRNGSGKSTLLKLLAGIFKPDSGQIESFGNTVSLQTLTAGFDVELSGKDNAIIGAMFLGKSKKEAIQSLDKIKEMSELSEEAFSQPVKSYSSGMRARLGFSVAITMETDVLLIDEVLGVGDAGFRKKAEAIIKDKIKTDLTVVLVSHASHQIKRLCNHVVWLESGEIVMSGSPDEIVSKYENCLIGDASNKVR